MYLFSNRWWKGSLAAVALGAVAMGSADATTLLRFSTPQLTVLSDAVVEGRVTNVEAKFREDHRYVYTYVTIEVTDTHKGRIVTNTIVLEELGGTANDITATVEGVPEFRVGEDVLVFLEARDEGLFKTYGWIQGKYTVELDPETNRLLATRPEIAEASFNYGPEGRLDVTVDAATGKRFHDTLISTIEKWADRLTVPEGE